MYIDIPYPDTDYKPGSNQRGWGTLSIELPEGTDLAAFVRGKVASGEITHGEGQVILSTTDDEMRRYQAMQVMRG